MRLMYRIWDKRLEEGEMREEKFMVRVVEANRRDSN